MEIARRKIAQPIEVAAKEDLEMYTYDERVIARAAIEELGGVVRYQGRWHVYDKSADVWRQCVNDGPIASAVLDVLERTYILTTKKVDGEETEVRKPVPRRANTASSIVQTMTWDPDVERISHDLPDGYVALADGMMSLTTRVCEPYNRRFVPNRVAITTAEAVAARGKPPQQWLDFMAEGFDANTLSVVQEFFGYLLMHEQPFQKALWIYGRPGCGKGTIIEIMRALVGQGNWWSGNADNLSSTYIGGAMLGKQLMTLPDFKPSRESFKGLQWMLAVIGNDAIQVEDKYSKAFSAVIHGKAVLGSNGLPTMPDDTGAVSRRLLVTQRHSRPDGALPDPYLSKRLASELPGILHWACDGLQRLLARGRFDSARLDAELQDHAAAASNQIYAWGRESIEIIKPVTSEDRSVFTPTSVLFDDYRMWCEGQNIRNTKTMNDFVVSMKQTYGSRIKADRGMHEGKQVRGFLYVRLRPDETEDEEQVTLPAARVRKPVVLP